MSGFVSRECHLNRIAVCALVCCVAAMFFHPPVFCAPAPSEQGTDLTAREKEKLVQQAVAHYEQKEMTKARQGLEKAQDVFPENYAVPYYLGLIYLEQEDSKGAIAQWQRYVKLAPRSKNALNIRKHLTLLLREQAREFAKQAMVQEAALFDGPVDDNTIAVASFKNIGSNDLGPLGKGMAAMLITDLSQVPDLQVVDRIKLHALLEEMKLVASGLVDAKTAPKVGKLLKARHVTSGSLTDLDKERLIIASAVSDTEKKSHIGAQEANGGLKEFYDLEKKIACQIIEDLGRNCDTVPEAFNKIHTRSMTALIWYSRGLDHFDEENYGQAREMFQKALEEDPQFDLAAVALWATPTAAIMSMSTFEMISTASSNGPSSSVAGTAVTGTSTTGAAAATTTSTMTATGVGISPTTMIIGGVAIAGGGALAGGGGGGGGGTGPASTFNLEGEWKGIWNSTDTSGQMTLTLTQTGSTVDNGTVTITGDSCLSTGTISGTVSGNNANLTIRSDAEVVELNAAADEPTKALKGTWRYTSSASQECQGRAGDFATTRPGSADVSW